MKKARLVTRNGMLTPNGREKVQEIRAGAKGTGRVIGMSVAYWPWSWRSGEAADEMISEQIRRAEAEGYQVDCSPDYGDAPDWYSG